MNHTPLCLNIAEISELTGLSISLIRKMTHSGEIPHIRVGRRILYPAEALAEWLSENTIGGTTIKKDGAADV
ncbi:helix-turn-helix domain-containing protein [Ruminococcus sp. XPD3002]|uniref:helix-turn-helix domain-containing protein n=1 Tax=Ruminococcus sp. XPD3002 TaxID=1452269 RepID=UPI000913D332|nr:DNA binding domain-containing protein, excisionase family [Ruminococcus flavefaciens]